MSNKLHAVLIKEFSSLIFRVIAYIILIVAICKVAAPIVIGLSVTLLSFNALAAVIRYDYMYGRIGELANEKLIPSALTDMIDSKSRSKAWLATELISILMTAGILLMGPPTEEWPDTMNLEVVAISVMTFLITMGNVDALITGRVLKDKRYSNEDIEKIAQGEK